ncbi:relaxase/mobilization nuclease domain-containing protein [Staphylococcus epidermidis]|uniref:relaxase/mobilization nuclease domain-containing protein n=1 Tax=Staphylococcus epidermidis TaxID=1282 RepID=UPI002874B0B6|nr:hypothetical protein [Staphylococcus epidermidis]MDS0998451.1 hypothetical protein [Staphylococcus epidermidis]
MSKNLSFIKVTNTKSIAKVSAHSKYIGFRSRENHQNEKGLFDRNKDNGVSHRQFTQRLNERRSLKHSQSNKAFKVVLSWNEKDARELGIHDEQKYKEVARDFVNRVEKDKNMKLDYIGAVHMKDGHPHVHLVISGVGDDKETGQDRRLRLDFKQDLPRYKDDLDRDIGADRLIQERQYDERLRGENRGQYQQRGGQREEFRNYNRYNKAGKDVTNDVFKTLEQMGKQARYESERARQQQERDMNKSEPDREDEQRERER